MTTLRISNKKKESGWWLLDLKKIHMYGCTDILLKTNSEAMAHV